LYPTNIDPFLCTHLNVGIASVVNNSLYIGDDLKIVFSQTKLLKKKNKNLKILLWVGGWYIGGFSDMVTNHTTRKEFIQSLKFVLETYHLDGVDLDWEFPVTPKNRMHFSQLLHEIRREYQREHRTYILSVAVAAPIEIVDVSYDVEELNSYADFINVMTYDFNFYSQSTPWTGELKTRWKN
jgi:chitinase